MVLHSVGEVSGWGKLAEGCLWKRYRQLGSEITDIYVSIYYYVFVSFSQHSKHYLDHTSAK